MRRVGRDVCGDFQRALSLEWLVTNGLGGYASGTVAMALSRRYHGLLIAALDPPTSRVLLVPKVDERATYRGRAYPLSANRWADGTIAPDGFRHLESFDLDGTAPVWRYALADAIVERRVWMAYGANATAVRYSVERAGAPVTLELDVFVDRRDHHGSTRAQRPPLRIEAADRGIAVYDAVGEKVTDIACDRMAWHVDPIWYYGFGLDRERERGLDERDDHLRAARAAITLAAGESCTLECCAAPEPASLDLRWQTFARREAELMAKYRSASPSVAGRFQIDRLALAADQFVVRRGEGRSVIAGYHWFSDWGRDAMIALPGLALATGRADEAKAILRTFGGAVEDGLLPNRFPDSSGPAEYNTADASLWFFHALLAYHAQTRDDDLVRELFPVLVHIVDAHVRGTRFHIALDLTDGLLHAGEPGVQLTWMDAKVGDRVITPRIGKPVEVNALWLNALAAIRRFSAIAGGTTASYDRLFAEARAGFGRFWHASAGYCYDVLDGPDGDDASLRPNQLYAVSLPESGLTPAQQRAVVDACAANLVTSYGLRSLAPDDPRYQGIYRGDPSQRDAAYHQGAVWMYLLGAFATAHYKVYRDREQALSFLEPACDALWAYGYGTLGEVFDGEPPLRPGGCIAQAWSVAEVLRALHEIAEETAG